MSEGPRTSRVGGQVIELVAERQLVRTAKPPPSPGTGEAAVRISTVGICGTDVHSFSGRDGRYPAVLGHDTAGVVVDVGEGVNRSWLGRRVTIEPTMACGSCPQCRAEWPNVCQRGAYLGMTAPGVMAEVVAVGSEQLVALPDKVSDRAASVLEPCAVALHMLDRIDGLLPDAETALVIGGGPMGVVVGRTLSLKGWGVVLFEPREERRDVAVEFGLDARPVSADHARDLGSAPRLVVETSAAEAGIRLAEELSTPRSVIALIGRAPVGPTPAALLTKELSVVAVKGGAGKYEEAVELVTGGEVPAEALITHAYGFSEAQRAFEEITDRRCGVVRSVLEGEW
jgi:threonine dehydrogenase-like Zn-dependent dehydrogenase